MLEVIKILGPQAGERGAENLGVAADPIMHAGFERFARSTIDPQFTGFVAVLNEDGGRFLVLRFAGEPGTAFQYQDVETAPCQSTGQRSAAHARADDDDISRTGHPFIEPASRPRIKNLPSRTYRIMVGAAAMAAPAMTTVQLTDWVPERLLRATVTGCCDGEKTTVTPKRKSFQILVNWKMPTTTKAGRPSGNMICQKILISPAPSIRAASMSSFGMLEK